MCESDGVMNGETKRIGTLRPMQDSDLKMVLSWRNAPDVRKNMYTQQEITLASHRQWWEKTKTDPSCQYFIFEAGGTAIGAVNFTEISSIHKTAFWGFYTGPEAPRGTGSRMELLALDHAFGPLALNKLCCEVLGFNQAVISLHHKFGFSEEGLFKAQKNLNNRYEDVHRLAIFAHDWAAARPKLLAKILGRL